MPIKQYDAKIVADFIKEKFGDDVYYLIVVADKPADVLGPDQKDSDMDCTLMCSARDVMPFLAAAGYAASQSAHAIVAESIDEQSKRPDFKLPTSIN